MAAPFLIDRGLDPASDGIGAALVMRLLIDLPAETPRYFRRLAEQPRMADATRAAATFHMNDSLSANELITKISRYLWQGHEAFSRQSPSKRAVMWASWVITMNPDLALFR